jgi:hypothetical protein
LLTTPARGPASASQTVLSVFVGARPYWSVFRPEDKRQQRDNLQGLESVTPVDGFLQRLL